MKHPRAIIALHWLMALMVAVSFSVILYRELIEDSEQRKFLLDVHRSLGLSILALVIVRAVIRLIWGRERPVELPRGIGIASSLGHVGLYSTMVALPLLGWAQSSARARHFKLFGTQMPSLVPHDADQADLLSQYHAWLAWAFLAFVGLHATMALWHHYVRKDNVLRAMLPGASVAVEPGGS